jgi:hypothetical protein
MATPAGTIVPLAQSPIAIESHNAADGEQNQPIPDPNCKPIPTWLHLAHLRIALCQLPIADSWTMSPPPSTRANAPPMLLAATAAH